MKEYFFGIDVGGTTIKCGLFIFEGECIDKWEIPTNKEENGSHILNDIADSIELRRVKNNLERSQIGGVGIGIPGPVKEDGTVLKCANLGWGIFNVVEKMRQLTGYTVKCANDANVAALGEMWMGGGKGYEDIVMVTLGTGVGSGIILNGKIVAGSNGAGGEIGHMIMNPKETALCGCGGHGHLEQYASATGIVRMAKERLKQDTNSSLSRIEALTAKDIFDAAQQKDAVALELVEELGQYLGRALSYVATVVDPQVFVIGGGVSRAGSILIDVIQKYYNQNIIYALANKEFHLARLGNDAGIYGCARLVLDQKCIL